MMDSVLVFFCFFVLLIPFVGVMYALSLYIHRKTCLTCREDNCESE